MITGPLRQDDLHRVLQKAPEQVVELLLGYPYSERPVFIAGGFVRSTIIRERPTDLDLYPADPKHFLDKLPEGWPDPVAVTQFATTFMVGHLPVQVITAFPAKDAETLLSHFDFTICQAAIHWDWAANAWRGNCATWFYADLAARRLSLGYKGPEPRQAVEAGGTLLRLMKFTRRGFSASPETVAKIALDATACALGEDPTELDLVPVIESLREVDPADWPWWALPEEDGP